MKKNYFLGFLSFMTGFLFIGCNHETTVFNLKPLNKKQIAKIYNKYRATEHKKYNLNKPYREIEENKLCIEESSNFKNVYCVGGFANDRGCMGDLVIVGDSIDKWNNIMPDVLKIFGWENEENRLTLSLNWVTGIVLCWDRVIHDKEKQIGNDFHQPLSEKQGSDYRVVLWVAVPPGMRRGNQYNRLEIIIDNKGKLKSNKIIDIKSVNF